MGSGPLARSADLIVDNIGDELLVYDSLNNRAHSLNTVGTAVWKACDGTRNAGAIAAHAGLDPAAVELALDNLSDVDLISGHQRTGISRRTALRRITVGAAGLAVALPVIRSITAPTAAMAVSCNNGTHLCNSRTNANASCCSTSYCNAHGSCESTAGLKIGPGAICVVGDSCLYGSHCGGSYKCAAGAGKAIGMSCSHRSSCLSGASCSVGHCVP